MELFKKKNTAIPLDKFFQLIKPQYKYLKITPDKSVRNYNTSNIAKSIKNTFKTINKRIRIEQKKLFFETNFKISYMVDIRAGKTDYYFIVPEVFLPMLQEKIREVWTKATITIEEGVEAFREDSDVYQVSYKKEDALSLNIDRKTNEPLNSILSVMEIMKDNDRVAILYNFIPGSNFGWEKQYNDTIEKHKLKQPLDKQKLTLKYAFKSSLSFLLSVINTLTETLGEFMGANMNKENNTIAFTEALATALSQNEELSVSTKKKKTASVLETQIAVISSSEDPTRKENNAKSVCHSFSALDEKGGNELQYKRRNTLKRSNFHLEDYRLNGIDSNKFSCEEAGNFIQIPGRSLLKSFNLEHIKTTETPVPKELSEGKKCLGEVKYREKKSKAFLEDEYNIGNLPLVMIGGQGAGKSTFMSNYSKDCCYAGEGLIVLDFIKNCELSETIKNSVIEDRVIELDMADYRTIQGLGYNEICVNDSMNSFDKMKLANLQSQQVMSLIDSISVGDPLSSRMRRFLNAAANVVFVQGYNSVKNVVECLERHEKRVQFVEDLSPELKELLEDEINTLDELNEYYKVSKKEMVECIEPPVVGTYYSKIEHILDRVSMLREDFKLKYMYNKPLEDNLNLVEAMNEGKIVLIKMKEGDFPSKMAKNILITYWISKIWLASQLRGIEFEKPSRINVLVDEVFQAPTCLKTLEYILPQSRKFGCKFIFSTQYIRQLQSIFDTLEASNSSYMLMRGCLEDDFNHFKSKLEDFEFEDLIEMKKFHSLNLIYYSGGYASFITKLPYYKDV
ncbi:hypothetical protein ACV3NC_14455 [Clostridium perfringens]